MTQQEYDEETGVSGQREVHWYGSGWAVIALIVIVGWLVW